MIDGLCYKSRDGAQYDSVRASPNNCVSCDAASKVEDVSDTEHHRVPLTIAACYMHVNREQGVTRFCRAFPVHSVRESPTSLHNPVGQSIMIPTRTLLARSVWKGEFVQLFSATYNADLTLQLRSEHRPVSISEARSLPSRLTLSHAQRAVSQSYGLSPERGSFRSRRKRAPPRSCPTSSVSSSKCITARPIPT